MLLITISRINKWGQQGNISKLLSALNHEDEEIRKAAALTLGKIGDHKIIEHLTYAIELEQNVFVKNDMETSLMMIKEKKFITGKPIFNEKEFPSNLKPLINYNIKLGSG